VPQRPRTPGHYRASRPGGFGTNQPALSPANRATLGRRSGPRQRMGRSFFPVSGGDEVSGSSPERGSVVVPEWAARLTSLTDDQREILRLRVVVGLSAEETATVLGLATPLVRILQHQALNQLRRDLEG
jgi:DNA-directed RNA polymerase specialized sigma24 family protein